MYKRNIFYEVIKRLNERRKFIQILSGARQTGKTTIAQQILQEINFFGYYISCDEPLQKNTTWIEEQWETVRFKLKYSKEKKAVFIIDEIQKIPDWAETIKRLWDEDTYAGRQIYLILLGSSPLLVNIGAGESLAGRYEIISVTHWSFTEMKKAFGWDINKYIFYGGYPGSNDLIEKGNERFFNYIIESIIESVILKDILQMTRVDKPALLRAVFQLGCSYSGRIVSYQKILGQLQDAGNTVTIAHYLQLLDRAGMLAGLQKFAGQKIRQRSSSPKFQVYNNALLTAMDKYEFKEIAKNKEIWGKLVESCVGAHLLNAIKGKSIELFYWNQSSYEVDYILKKADKIITIEVKSGSKKTSLPGIEKFSKEFKVYKKLLVGTGGIPLEEFLSIPVEELFKI